MDFPILSFCREAPAGLDAPVCLGAPHTATCGEGLITLLERYGVEYVFGIPGVHTIELYRGLAASSIQHVTPRHEQGAGFMADGYARVTGKPGVCFIITGPGMTNIATAMAQAYADSIPMLVISSVNARRDLGGGNGRLHELPSQRAVFSNLAAFSHTLLDANDLPQVLARAFAVFASARPRPVHIEIPLDVIVMPTADQADAPVTIATRPAPDAAAIASAAQCLAQARRPLILAGGGAIHAGEPLRALAERLQAPVALTINAKGLLPRHHPLLIGSTQSLPPTRELICEADVVLAVGTELGETDYDTVFDGGFAMAGRLIRIDIDAEQLMRNFRPDMAIMGDTRMALSNIAAEISAGAPVEISADATPKINANAASKISADATYKINANATSKINANAASKISADATPEISADAAYSPAKNVWGAARVAAVRAAIANHYDAPTRSQAAMIETIAATLPGVIIVGDSTSPVYAGNLTHDADAPRSWFNASTGYGSLGYGLPAAIGAKLAAPQRPVVCWIGDGGLQFTLPELASAVEAGAAMIVIVWNNQGYGEIRKFMTAHGITPIGVDTYTPDFLTLAQGFGCVARAASDSAELAMVLREAAAAKTPTVIEIREIDWFAKVRA